jgi:hypothetical protein
VACPLALALNGPENELPSPGWCSHEPGPPRAVRRSVVSANRKQQPRREAPGWRRSSGRGVSVRGRGAVPQWIVHRDTPEIRAASLEGFALSCAAVDNSLGATDR